MLVNNNFGKRATVNLKLDPSITALYEVSRENGGYSPLEIAGNLAGTATGCRRRCAAGTAGRAGFL